LHKNNRSALIDQALPAQPIDSITHLGERANPHRSNPAFAACPGVPQTRRLAERAVRRLQQPGKKFTS
jgi:hypothetical protein